MDTEEDKTNITVKNWLTSFNGKYDELTQPLTSMGYYKVTNLLELDDGLRVDIFHSIGLDSAHCSELNLSLKVIKDPGFVPDDPIEDDPPEDEPGYGPAQYCAIQIPDTDEPGNPNFDIANELKHNHEPCSGSAVSGPGSAGPGSVSVSDQGSGVDDQGDDPMGDLPPGVVLIRPKIDSENPGSADAGASQGSGPGAPNPPPVAPHPGSDDMDVSSPGSSPAPGPGSGGPGFPGGPGAPGDDQSQPGLEMKFIENVDELPDYNPLLEDLDSYQRRKKQEEADRQFVLKLAQQEEDIRLSQQRVQEQQDLAFIMKIQREENEKRIYLQKEQEIHDQLLAKKMMEEEESRIKEEERQRQAQKDEEFVRKLLEEEANRDRKQKEKEQQDIAVAKRLQKQFEDEEEEQRREEEERKAEEEWRNYKPDFTEEDLLKRYKLETIEDVKRFVDHAQKGRASYQVSSALQVKRFKLHYRYHGSKDPNNDKVLFHATSAESCLKIQDGHFIPSSGGMLGAGIYFAPDPHKSMGYVKGGVKCMLLCLVNVEGAKSRGSGASFEYCVTGRKAHEKVIPLYVVVFK